MNFSSSLGIFKIDDTIIITPIDETIAIFGDVVDSYTMKESSDDGITVRIAYEPRLARVIESVEQAKEIQKYYDRCSEQGSTAEQIEESKKAMTKMRVILGDSSRLHKLAVDIADHYETLCAEKPDIVQKATLEKIDNLLTAENISLSDLMSERVKTSITRHEKYFVWGAHQKKTISEK